LLVASEMCTIIFSEPHCADNSTSPATAVVISSLTPTIASVIRVGLYGGCIFCTGCSIAVAIGAGVYGGCRCVMGFACQLVWYFRDFEP
jgi:hypothetical protein